MRARNIKPGFFKNEDLAECSPFARILFIGLWCMADKSGRLEDRPKRIKAEILPYDSCDAEELLSELCDYGFIVRYTAQGKKCIVIPAFLVHQRPHSNETASRLPTPEKELSTLVESAVNQSEKHCLPNSQALRSDSLIPSSLNAESLKEEERKKADATASPLHGKKIQEYVAEIRVKENGIPFRVTKAQAEKWQQTFKLIDVEAELYKLSLWSEENPNKRWTKKGAMHATARALGNSNQRALHEQNSRDPTFDVNDPDGSKAAEMKRKNTLELVRKIEASSPYD